jgi:hypothetical protein
VKKTSLYIEEELDRALARRAAEEELTKAELIRRVLAGAVGRARRPKPQAVGIASSGRPDLASRDEDHLAEGFGEWR